MDDTSAPWAPEYRNRFKESGRKIANFNDDHGRSIYFQDLRHSRAVAIRAQGEEDGLISSAEL